MYVYVITSMSTVRPWTRSREHVKALFDGHNGPEGWLQLAPLAMLLLYDGDQRA